MKKMTVLCIVTSMALFASYAAADVIYTCTNTGQERTITIVYQDQVTKVPCEVIYQKGDVTETLWSAQNEVGYCEAKVEAFLEKQRGWGWACNASAVPASEEGMMSQKATKEEAQETAPQEVKGDI
ncbi:MAG: hypothetical protein C0624_12225 [Desulfuromonas sp.]|nr:MAG: hypothetical protein C0624_12225 [Desulfuromonas sp.]